MAWEPGKKSVQGFLEVDHAGWGDLSGRGELWSQASLGHTKIMIQISDVE